MMNTPLHAENSTSKKVNDRITDMKKRHIIELRESILKYRVLSGKKQNRSLNYTTLPNCCNIIVFGPSKSGKSSLIKQFLLNLCKLERTFYQSLYNTTNLPKEYNANLIIQKLTTLEGTKKFTQFVLKQEKKNIIQTDTTKMICETSQINLYDTRGQIMMDENEIKQIDIIMEGKIKNMSLVQQRTCRYAYLLWEFWKKDSDLFPKEIISDGDITSRPHILLFVFDGSIDIASNREEEFLFYRNILQRARSKSITNIFQHSDYFYPQIVLTKVDQVEEKIRNSLSSSTIDSYELEEKLREAIDLKIEEVVVKLGVPRESVHFIENYHEKKNNYVESIQDVEIDYYALRLLQESLAQADNYLESVIPNSSLCDIF